MQSTGFIAYQDYASDPPIVYALARDTQIASSMCWQPNAWTNVAGNEWISPTAVPHLFGLMQPTAVHANQADCAMLQMQQDVHSIGPTGNDFPSIDVTTWPPLSECLTQTIGHRISAVLDVYQIEAEDVANFLQLDADIELTWYSDEEWMDTIYQLEYGPCCGGGAAGWARCVYAANATQYPGMSSICAAYSACLFSVKSDFTQRNVCLSAFYARTTMSSAMTSSCLGDTYCLSAALLYHVWISYQFTAPTPIRLFVLTSDMQWVPTWQHVPFAMPTT